MIESAGETAGAAGLFMPPLAAAINHVLRSASWARDKLAPFAGRVVRFDVPPFSANLEILANGEVAASSADAATTFKLTPALGVRMAAADPDAWREVESSGDMALAREILTIAQNLRWDVEEDLSRIFGDIIAHRLANAGRALAQWQRDSAASLVRQAAGYWTEERPLIAARPDIEQFGRDVDTLRDDVARVEQRIEQLARKHRPQT